MDKNYLADMAKTLQDRLPDNHGFILLAFEFSPGGRLYYTANCDRVDAINCLKEFLIQAGAEEDWMKHIK